MNSVLHFVLFPRIVKIFQHPLRNISVESTYFCDLNIWLKICQIMKYNGIILTFTDVFIHQFTKAGTYYFWGGAVDLSEGIRGVIYVKQRSSHSEFVNVTVNNFEAEHQINNTGKRLPTHVYFWIHKYIVLLPWQINVYPIYILCTNEV